MKTGHAMPTRQKSVLRLVLICIILTAVGGLLLRETEYEQAGSDLSTPNGYTAPNESLHISVSPNVSAGSTLVKITKAGISSVAPPTFS